ncbi:MAG: hypothetical protein ACI9BW_002007 [Gammaproteobacteria bacterium]
MDESKSGGVDLHGRLIRFREHLHLIFYPARMSYFRPSRLRIFWSRGKWSFLVLKYSSMVSIMGLAIGVIGPIVLIPEANQGPLLGLLIFGPGGFFCGAALGSFIACGERQLRRGPF